MQVNVERSGFQGMECIDSKTKPYTNDFMTVVELSSLSVKLPCIFQPLVGF